MGRFPVDVLPPVDALDLDLGKSRFDVKAAILSDFSAKNHFGDTYRNYETSARQSIVEENYRKAHTQMTVENVGKLHDKWLSLNHGAYTVMEALELLNELVDDSDPDVECPNIYHAYMTAERIREAWPDDEYDWFWLTGLLHDLGKVMACWGAPQWAVVGDTFPVGCEFSDKVVFSKQFDENPDAKDPRYNTKYGIYEPNTGLDNLMMSFGHDEYMYHVLVKNACTLNKEGLNMIRFHSFYPWHDAGAYTHLTTQEDEELVKPWVKEFNKFDLYSKGDELPDIKDLEPFYQKLCEKYNIGGKLRW